MSILRSKKADASKNRRPVDGKRKLSDGGYEGYYLLGDGRVIHVTEYEGFGEDEEFMESYENDPAETRLVGGVYYDISDGTGGVMGYTGSDTLSDFDGFQSIDSGSRMESMFLKSGDRGYDDYDDAFMGLVCGDKGPEDVRAVAKRYGLYNRRRARWRYSVRGTRYPVRRRTSSGRPPW